MSQVSGKKAVDSQYMSENKEQQFQSVVVGVSPVA